jgi:hypothetical protein
MKAAEDEAAAYLNGQGKGAAGGAAGGPAANGGGQAFAGAQASATGSTKSGGGFLSKVGGFFSSVGGGIKDFALGAVDEVVDMGKGLWNVATDPIGTIKGLYHGITHPGELWDAFKKPYVEAWESGHPWRAIGRGALFVGSLFIGAGEIGGAGKVAGAAGKAGEAAKVARVAEAAQAARLAEMARLGDVAGLTKAAEAARAARLAELSGLAAKYPTVMEAAEALGKATKGSAEAAELAEFVALQSTHIKPPAGRVVLGKWEATGGYIGEAKAGGGIWYETADGVYAAAGKEATWATNEAFLRQQMSGGVPRLEFHGMDVTQTLLDHAHTPASALPARVKEIQFIEAHAAEFGYVRQGNTYVRQVPGGPGVAPTIGRAGVAGETVETARRSAGQ